MLNIFKKKQSKLNNELLITNNIKDEVLTTNTSNTKSFTIKGITNANAVNKSEIAKILTKYKKQEYENIIYYPSSSKE